MRNAIIIFIFQLLFLGPAYGQAPEKRFVGNCSFSGFALVSDSTYRGNITRFDDRMGDGYNLTQLATGYEIFDGRGLVFSIGTIHSSTNFTADVTVTAKVNRGFEPFGSGQVYYPTANGLIPPSSQEQAGLSPTQKARIDRHNVVTMQSLIGGRDSVYSITNVPDTSALTPVMGDIFVNAAGDTLGVYNTSWVLFFGGGSAETADGLTILGDGTGGDPFRTDTTLMSTRTYADSLFAAADSLRQAGDRKAPVFIQAFDRNTQLPACASSATVAVGFYLIDDAPINSDDIVFDIDASPATITYDYYSQDSTVYYFEYAGVTSVGSYFWEVDYFDDDGNVAEDANFYTVTAGRPDTVTTMVQDSILVTRVCGVEISRDTVQHPFSTTSPELEISGGELKLARQSAKFNDALRWNGVDAYEPAPVNSFEFLTDVVEVTMCNNADTCDYTSLAQALDFSSQYIGAYDSLTANRVIIRIRPNPGGTPTEINSTKITGGVWSNVKITSAWADTISIVNWDTGSGNEAIFLQSVIGLNIDSFRVIKTGAATNKDGFRVNDSNTNIFSNVTIEGFQMGMNLKRSTGNNISDCTLLNQTNRGLWFQRSGGNLIERTDIYGNAVDGMKEEGSGVLVFRNCSISNNRTHNFWLNEGAIALMDNVDFSADTLLANYNYKGTGGSIITLKITDISDNNNYIYNQVTDGNLILSEDYTYNFVEAATASEPSAAEIRYYYNTDEEELKISDGVSWYGINTIAGISVFSNTTAKSLYTMSSGVNVEFESSSNSPILYLSESNKRVGIGTDNPQADLNIVSTSGAPTIRMKGTGSVSLGASFGINNPSHVEFWNFENGYMRFGTNNTEIMRFVEGQCGVGVSAPQAALHLKAGTSSIPSLRIIEGVSPTSPADGDINHVSDNLLFTSGTTVYTLAKTLTATASLDFSSTSAQNSADLTITVTGAADGDAVSLGVPNAAVNANTSFSAWVSAADTVTIRFNNYSSSAIDPASGTFRAVVTQY